MTDLRQGVTPIQHEVFDKIERAIAKFPTWPTDPLHALAVLGEEFGELTKAVLQSVYEPHKSSPGDVREEAVQTAAMALRFLASLDMYTYSPGIQHSQSETCDHCASIPVRATLDGEALCQACCDNWVRAEGAYAQDITAKDCPY